MKVNSPIRSPYVQRHPTQMLIYVQQGNLKHTRGETINYLSAGDSLIERNSGSPHFVESVGKKLAVLFVGRSYTLVLPTTIN